MRALKGRNFWIMEQTAGCGGWGVFKTATCGRVNCATFAYQQLARGAEGQIWFRWRTCTAGREQYWHGVLGHDGRPLRRYPRGGPDGRRVPPAGEARRGGRGLQPKPPWSTTTTRSGLCAFSPGTRGCRFRTALARYYDALFRAGVTVDMVPPGADFSR